MKSKKLLQFIENKIGISLTTGYSKDFIGFSFGYFISSFISFVIIAVINKNLSPESLGEYSYLKSIFELIYGILSLQIYTSYLRFNINGKNRTLEKFVLSIVLVASLLFSIFIWGFTKCVICCLFSAIIVYNERIYYFRSTLEMKKLNLARIIPLLIILCLILVWFLFKKEEIDYKYIFFAYGLGYLFVLFLFRNKSSRYNQSTINKKEILKYSLPAVGLITIDWVLNLSAQVLIKEYYSFVELSYYAVAQRSLLVVKLFSGLFLMFYPMIYFREIEKKNKKFIRKSRTLMIITIFIVIIIFLVLAKYVYIIMGARSYLSHLNIFKILLFSETFRVFSSFFGLFFTYKIQTFKNFIILLIGAILNVCLLLLFLKDLGIEFAAIASLLSNALIFVLYIFSSYRMEKKFLNNKI